MKPEHFEKMRIDLNNQILLEDAISNLKQGNSHIQIHNFVGTRQGSQLNVRGVDGLKKKLSQVGVDFEKIPYKVAYPVETTMKYTGRSNELSKISEIIENNMNSHLAKKKTKQFYQFGVIVGGVGLGKTRTCLEGVFRCIEKNCILEHKHIFIDIGRGDKQLKPYYDFDYNNPNISIGMRITARYFLGIGIEDLVPILKGENYDLFTLINVLTLIGEPYKKNGTQLLLTLQLDEFQDFEHGEMTLAMGNIMSTEHDLGVQLIPFLSGTGDAALLKTLKVSTFKGIEIILQPCEGEDTKGMIKSCWSPAELKKKQFVSDEDLERVLQDSVNLCGNIPRFNEFFHDSLEDALAYFQSKVDYDQFMNYVQQKIVNYIKTLYTANVWDKLLGQKDVLMGSGLARMCLYSLIQKEVILADKLNRYTVDDAKNNGVIYLKQVDPDTKKDVTENTKYLITLPLVLMDFFNQEGIFCEKGMLHPYAKSSWSSFEEIIMQYRMILQNVSYVAGVKSMTYEDFFGKNLLGWSHDLKTSVNTSNKISLVDGFKRDTSIKSTDDYDVKKIPIGIGESDSIDLTEGKHIVRNQERGNSADAFFFARQDLIEYEQFKASEFIERGIPPSVKPGNMIQIKDLQQELDKTKKKRNFSDQKNTILLVFSNKPLENYDDVKSELQKNDSNCKFPRGVLLICNQNFRDCISPTFSSFKKLYISAVSTCCCQCRSCNGKNSCDCTRKKKKCKCATAGKSCHSECGAKKPAKKVKKRKFERDEFEFEMDEIE
jgi:hypothetical protein